jgi:hypothetical protein
MEGQEKKMATVLEKNEREWKRKKIRERLCGWGPARVTRIEAQRGHGHPGESVPET